ncbi:MAG: outer membrane lipid asymmetry maintenance protein MlaD [Ferrovum sp. 37-45-19]|uniref:outer membrane lipid asymmetry maintenance protein MlaD n=1 Tax=Ferrovum sp. JA12 TaxID=1356299 RepID=UPI0007035236|nr:outer membrane lipid asymmetry maintenance protein MlaD [Ferrovum sp. JA12]OYV79614.1 MAG: outer membrane lipid asymmetry maintenance protein MlaD [Ferrovum sp. 21-44-67]OYV94591.1 MAG: outer membrane lipid asymmetry maintenance protein MlaD [Ferrovum sp. 37-45-19]OZB34581.1 MAG: outer membrane lipid asymmetry maintenance protein MlaD [Ferrovum sp. 34-44-207]HQT81539.1 outer membrane lipid asymmetry maintenance protein MlaD [Ferrovaceae bacterium]KRH79511.1 putative phospholipid ABC transpo
MERSTLNLWVGIFVLLGFFSFLMLAFKVGNLNLSGNKDTYIVIAHFDNIGQLKERAPVRSAGVLVGRVKAIQFDSKQYNAEVKIAIDSQFHFPVDTSASILTSGILGEQYVSLDAGGDEKYLKNGDQIKLVQGAVVLEKLIGQFLYNKAQDSSTDKGAAK